ncbi:Bacteriophytochrome cph2 [Dermatophilus congolensis]|uniref:Bacteriophytochrome cph2 n=1 Tax=Dermatophilus congolensis TaxID=1863 RepID=A0AA46BPB0_9MICO|nr:bifunctional diguanylate cyclase/phosphodiesterase [Dermatophilus congolensis]STD12380.1 Bacteriophytochrome cph2 [Dermatophilus congolensis]
MSIVEEAERAGHKPPLLRRATHRQRALILLFVFLIPYIIWLGDRANATQLIATNALMLVLASTVAATPLLAAYRPRRLWVFFSLTWLCPVGATLVRNYPGSPDPHIANIALFDILSLASYVIAGIWVLYATWHLTGLRGLTYAIFDTSAATIGIVIATWAISQQIHPTGRTADLAWAIYPIVDLAILGFAGQVLFRIKGTTPGLNWFLTGVLIMLAVHGVVTYYALNYDSWPPSWIMGFNLFSWASFIAGITHPHIKDWGKHVVKPVDADNMTLRNVYVIVAVTATSFGLLTPMLSTFDYRIRSLLVVALLLLLISRLIAATRHLALSERDSSYRATHDQLTGLLNRFALHNDLNRRLLRQRSNSPAIALIYLDCDAFKDVNDTWGHDVGDKVLQHLAAGMREATGPEDTVARHGGDEFALVTEVTDEAEALALAAKLQALFSAPVAIGARRGHTVTASMGIALACPHEQHTAAELLSNADLALHRAKATGRGTCTLYDSVLKEQAVKRAVMSEALREALSRNALSVAFQPIFRGNNYSELAGWEALARWQHPTLGPIPPNEFIPLAEELGLICDLGDLILRKSAAEFSDLISALGLEDVSLSVNVSVAQLLQANFVDTVLETLDQVRLSPCRIVLEITESMLVDDDSPALDTLHRLRQAGLALSLDDFGTGYASITTLLNLPIDGVKLDRSLVKRLDDDPAAPARVKAVLDLVASVGINRVTAEGIETPEQSQALAQLGCPRVQGFFYGRPVPSAQILTAPVETG